MNDFFFTPQKTNDEVRLKLSPPWVTYVNKLKALFDQDPEIQVIYNNDERTVNIYVENSKKAWAIEKLLPMQKQIGNIQLKITVVPANGGYEVAGPLSTIEIFDLAFKDNPIYAYSKEISGLFSNKFIYVVFKNKVVQFFNDNLNDIHGLISTLYQNIAYEIFEDANINLMNVFFNTDIEEKVWTPLGEWP